MIVLVRPLKRSAYRSNLIVLHRPECHHAGSGVWFDGDPKDNTITLCAKCHPAQPWRW